MAKIILLMYATFQKRRVLLCLFTHHACCLNSLGHTPSVWLTPKGMTLKVLVSCVHDEGESMDIMTNTHEGQKAHATLHQHLIILLRNTEHLNQGSLLHKHFINTASKTTHFNLELSV